MGLKILVFIPGHIPALLEQNNVSFPVDGVGAAPHCGFAQTGYG
jgi:hypothetical protein